MPPNIIWITGDSLRSDFVEPGANDYHPNLDRIVEDRAGIAFENCISQGRWTPASTASILSGTYLSTHGVTGESAEVSKLPRDLSTLPELLKRSGYTTVGLSGNDYFSPATGLDRGFDAFTLAMPNRLHRDFSLTTLLTYGVKNTSVGGGFSLNKFRHNLSYFLAEKSSKVIRSQERNIPLFLYVHFDNTHWPYSPPPKFMKEVCTDYDLSWREAIRTTLDVFGDMHGAVADGLELTASEWEALEATYVGEILFLDWCIGKVYDAARTLEGETIIVVTGDDGDLFGERGWLGHQCITHPKLVHVPLIASGLDSLEVDSSDVVQHIDVTRTLAEAVGVESDQFQGVDLRDSSGGFAVSERAPIKDKDMILERNPDFDFSEYHQGDVKMVFDNSLLIEDGDWLSVRRWPTLEPYSDESGRIESLREKAEGVTDGRGVTYSTPDAELSDAALRRLRDVGYL